METKTTQTFDLSHDDVETAVAQFIEKKFGKGAPITVSIRAVPRTTGFGMNESTTYVAEISAKREA